MKNINELEIVSSLRQLCIDNNWFTAGSNEQYEMMFEVAKEAIRDEINEPYVTNFAFNELVTIIWICTADVTREDSEKIFHKLESWKDKMLIKEC